MARVWLKTYREGSIPEQIDPDLSPLGRYAYWKRPETYAAEAAFRCFRENPDLCRRRPAVAQLYCACRRARGEGAIILP